MGRKKESTMREAESEVKKAEELTAKVAEAAAVLEDDTKILSLSAQDLREATDATITAEKAANVAVAEARKFVTSRQIEAKGKDASPETSAELAKFQNRLGAAQAEIVKYKKSPLAIEKKLAAKQVVEEATARLAEAEEKVTKCGELVDALVAESEKTGEEEKEKEG